MKKLYVSVLAVLACIISFAQASTTFTAFVTPGTWSTASHWTTNGTSASNKTPGAGDIVIIPLGYTMTITSASNISIKDLDLRVSGTLIVQGTLNASGNWSIQVQTGGKITTGSAGIITRTISGSTTSTVLPSNSSTNGASIANSTNPLLTYIALPVKFTGFSVARQNSDVLVQWSTAEEVNADSYVIERSTDGNNWTGITTVAARGNTSSLTNYTYIDKNVTAPIAYYRVKQVDIDGKYTYTTTRAIKAGAAAVEVKVAAINNRVVLQFSNEVKGAVEVRLVTLGGQVVSREVLHEPVGQVILNSTPAKGSYVVSVSNAQDIHVARQVRF